MSFVNIYRENENNNENSSHDFSHDNFDRENHESFEANDHRQFKRQQFMNFNFMFQILIINNILHDKRFFDFASKKRNHIKFHD